MARATANTIVTTPVTHADVIPGFSPATVMIVQISLSLVCPFPVPTLEMIEWLWC